MRLYRIGYEQGGMKSGRVGNRGIRVVVERGEDEKGLGKVGWCEVRWGKEERGMSLVWDEI